MRSSADNYAKLEYHQKRYIYAKYVLHDYNYDYTIRLHKLQKEYIWWI